MLSTKALRSLPDFPQAMPNLLKKTPVEQAELCSLRSSNPAELGGEPSVRISWS